MYIESLVNITSRAWAMAILAKLHEGVPGRQAKLLAATGAARGSFAQSMDHLIEMGLVERNPGHGHPLRPEFRLTASGARAGRLAHRIHQEVVLPEQAILRRAWTLPVLGALHHNAHFNDVRRSLPGITDRALSQSLKLLEQQDWVRRDVSALTRPPRSLYVPINAGARISVITGAGLFDQPATENA